mgnify:CR=1 FL=1
MSAADSAPAGAPGAASTGSGSLVLGIESSCDETGASVVRDGRAVLANAVASQHDLHAKFGGVVPEIASRAHIERILPIIDAALEAAGVWLDRVDAVAVGHRPGLIGSLLVGVAAAKTLAWSLGKPLVGVDHVRAHLYAAALDDEPIDYPALGLVVSGGHSNLYAMNGPLDMRLLGRTIDDAVGEAYDKVAAICNLGFPGGPVVDRRAQQGDPASINFPRTMLGRDSLDFSFSGLKTAVLYHVRGKPRGRGGDASFERDAADLDDQQINDICAAFQAAVIDVLLAKIERAIEQLGGQRGAVRSLVIGGGVSANSGLREHVHRFARSHGLAVRVPAMKYCLDNAAMIAGLAHHQLHAGQTADLDLEAIATTELR